MWRYLLALGAALYLGMWFVGSDHGQTRWGLRDAPVQVKKPEVPVVEEVSAVTPATPLVTVPKAEPAAPNAPVVQPLAPTSAFSAEAEAAAATVIEPEPEVFTLADPNGAAYALNQKVITPTPEPAHKAVAEAMSRDPFASPEAQTEVPPAPVAQSAEAPPPAEPAAAPANARTILGRAVNLRKGPSNNELSVSTLFRGDLVEVLSQTVTGWVKVRSFADGSEGYVPSRFLSTAVPN